MIYVCEADLKEGELRGLKVEGQWLLVALHDSTYYLLDAACAHSGYPLHDSKKVSPEGVITCPLHYAQFDCVTGKVVSDPAICDNQPTFRVLVKEGKVYWLNG